jgi:hypothetical protein
VKRYCILSEKVVQIDRRGKILSLDREFSVIIAGQKKSSLNPTLQWRDEAAEGVCVCVSC